MGNLIFQERQEGSSLQQELLVLSLFFSELSVETHTCVLAGSVRALHSLFARIDISAGVDRISQASESAGIMDINKNLQRLYEMPAIGIMDIKEIVREIKSMGETVSYTSLQINNHDAQIDDNESNLREIMGKVDRIQEDLQSLITMNQGSKVNGAIAKAEHPMEEESVVQPKKFRGNP